MWFLSNENCEVRLVRRGQDLFEVMTRLFDLAEEPDGFTRQ